jgi:serine/threonine protein kinase
MPVMNLAYRGSQGDINLTVAAEPFAKGSDASVYAGVSKKNPTQAFALKITKLAKMSIQKAKEEMRIGQIAGSRSASLAAFSSGSEAILLMRPMQDDLGEVNKSLDNSRTDLTVRSALTARFMVSPMRQLAKMHKNQLIHGDIKPNNLSLTREGNKVSVQLADFGNSSDESASLDGSPRSGGSASPGSSPRPEGAFEFSAPELYIEGMNRCETGGPEDIWAAGMSLLILATGDHLFGLPLHGLQTEYKRFSNMFKMMQQMPEYRAWEDEGRSDVDNPFAERFAKVSHPALRQLIEDMLRCTPENRPTADAVASQLETIVASLEGTPEAAKAENIMRVQNSLQQRMQPLMEDLVEGVRLQD